jgi:hypothetical protein
MIFTYNNILPVNSIKQQINNKHTETKASSIKSKDITQNTASDILANQNIAMLNLPFKGIIKVKFEQAKPIISESEFKNPNFLENVSEVLSYDYTQEQMPLVKKFFSNEKLYNNNDLAKRIGKFITFADTPQRIQITNKMLSHTQLTDSKSFVKGMGL